jgi:hypothetical protein
LSTVKATFGPLDDFESEPVADLITSATTDRDSNSGLDMQSSPT